MDPVGLGTRALPGLQAGTADRPALHARRYSVSERPQNRDLAVLEAIVGPPERTKGGWLGPAYDEMAETIGSLKPSDRDRTIAALDAWLVDDEVTWHPDAALALAVRLGSRPLFAAAAKRAREFGLHEDASERMEPWESFHRTLIAATVENPISPAARNYVAELAEQFENATGLAKREVTGAAWFARCRIEGGRLETKRVSRGLDIVRASDDERLIVGLLGFVAAIYRTASDHRRKEILGLFTEAERRRVIPSPRR